jgi:hypothetical protein
MSTCLTISVIMRSHLVTNEVKTKLASFDKYANILDILATYVDFTPTLKSTFTEKFVASGVTTDEFRFQ